jgi:outer membrane protein assembly factor BamB
VGGDTYSSQINVQQGNVFIGTTRGTLWNYSPITGQSIFSIPANTGPILGTANIDTSSRVFFGSGSNLFACPIDRTQSAEDLVYTNVVGNITSGVTLAVDFTKSTRAFFTTDAKRMYCVQIDLNVGAYTNPGYLIRKESLPILDISYAYVIGETGGGSLPCVFRFPWYSVDLTTGNLTAFGSFFDIGATTFAPNLLINSSSSIVLLANTGLFTLS